MHEQARNLPSRLTILVCGLVMCTALTLGGCRKAEPPPPPPPAPAPAPEPQVEKATEAAVQSLSDLATEYEVLQQQADQTNRKIVDAVAKYQKRGGKLPPNFGPDLSDEQRQMLAERIQQEKAGTRALLQDIIDRDKQIQELRARAADVKTKLPDHVTAKDGDRHDRIAMNYLIGKGVSTQKAFQIVSELNLEEALVPGFSVWTFYSDGQFGTWVTKGSATVSPQEHQKRIAKLLAEERDTANKLAAELKTQVVGLQEQAKSASAEAGALLTMLEKAEAEKKAALAAALAVQNTVKYSLGDKKQLQKMKVVDGRLKLMSLDQADVFSINLAEKTTISIDGTNFGLKKIKKLTLVPEVFVQGKDYQVEQDGAFATVKLMNLDKFKSNQFVIVVE
jgi:uncharacterized coiled-coil DUF342 family protein